ncbi:hypothetical protein B0I35DRAFT_473710 [Stachybotrys elegans]|uniref:Uncharacterized protein n=1 Tax=Stachybotrys elegans TaxID=80388 RepID=A0A8K0WYM7_9HYPO|nr:hypothetical protein B0I35DRAFT_473710 [Stachybotrys elegans]
MPTTPEPFACGDAQPPSPPRPPRFRLKKRNASHLHAPTQQFLASVAAADVPIPSIEVPQTPDQDMSDTQYPVIPMLHELGGLTAPSRHAARVFSPPKTPAPAANTIPFLSPKRYPDWSMESTWSSFESSPEYESSRPSTARSTQTSGSIFSRISTTSEDLSVCLSPEFEPIERFGSLRSAHDANRTLKVPAPGPPARSRKAPWTRAMSQHVWATYMMYLQDPKVTPFRVGKSGIPPHGVCLRVAREAKRSWKGSRAQRPDDKSGSTTPTFESAPTFMQWPHTCAVTRAHLRDLCRANASAAARSFQYHANSPTPFGKAASRFRNRRSTPARSPSVFSGFDMAKSLAVSTSDSMQIQGPLAQLTSSQPEPATEPFPLLPETVAGEPAVEPPRLMSPFTAKSYGPSSSNPLSASLRLSPELQRQTQTVGPRRSLASPARLTRSRSNTQKRRERQSAMEPRRPKRPSLVSDMWTDPSAADADATVPFPPVPDFNATTSSAGSDKVVPRANIQELFETRTPPIQTRPHATSFAIPSSSMLPRLGSPFSFRSSSFSFPNRLSSPFGLDADAAARRPFATVQQPTDNAGSSNPKSSLATRLAYIDERLKDLRRRGARRRSESPL